MEIKISLKNEHLAALQETTPSDRGYILVERKSGLLVAKRVLPGSRGNTLVDRSELGAAIMSALHESGGVIPYIHDSNDHYDEALGIAEHEMRIGMDKVCAYGQINGRVRFYAFQNTASGPRKIEVPFSLRS